MLLREHLGSAKIPASCTSCTASASCAAGTTCRHGYCEADDGRTSLSDCSALASGATHAQIINNTCAAGARFQADHIPIREDEHQPGKSEWAPPGRGGADRPGRGGACTAATGGGEQFGGAFDCGRDHSGRRRVSSSRCRADGPVCAGSAFSLWRQSRSIPSDFSFAARTFLSKPTDHSCAPQSSWIRTRSRAWRWAWPGPTSRWGERGQDGIGRSGSVCFGFPSALKFRNGIRTGSS